MKASEKNRILVAMAIWLGILGSVAYWFEMDTRQEERHLALTTANAFFQQILISRQWNASHAGVYVPATEKTPPNPYLPTELQELTTDSGMRLARVNPSYMTRQMTELAKKNEGGMKF